MDQSKPEGKVWTNIEYKFNKSKASNSIPVKWTWTSPKTKQKWQIDKKKKVCVYSVYTLVLSID